MATVEAGALSRERVSAIANDILSAFESGELPKALANLFIHRKVDVPSRAWTWTNRLVAIRHGHVYTAGFRQWQEVGRYVKKGEHAFHILAPRIAIDSQRSPAGSHLFGQRRIAALENLPNLIEIQSTRGNLSTSDRFEQHFRPSAPLGEQFDGFGPQLRFARRLLIACARAA